MRSSPPSACRNSRSASSTCPGTWIVQPGSAATSATSSGAWCVRPCVRRVVRRADADEDGAEVVVAEVELEHLVRPLDEERRVRVRDRPVALEREPGGDADHQLLADAHVEVARMLADRLVPDLRGDDGDPLVLVERLAGELVEAFAHRRHLACTSATMQRGRAASGSGASAASSASWSRPSTRSARPALEHEAALDPVRPAVGRGVVVDHDRSQRRQPDPPGVLHRLPVRSLVELPVADEARRRGGPSSATPDRDAEPVAERAARDLDARRTSMRSGW